MSGISLSRQRRPKRATGMQWSAGDVAEKEEPIEVFEALSFLSAPETGENVDLVYTLISGIRGLVEKQIGRLLVRRDVTAYWKRVPDHVDLPLPPHGSIQEVRRGTGEGEMETLATDKWYARGHDRKSVYPAGGARHGLEVDYTAGYESVPDALRMQMLRDIKDRFDQRDDIVVGSIATQLPDPSAYDAWRVLS